MFRKSYNVASAEKKNDKGKSASSQSYGTMTLKKKAEITNLNNQTTPECHRKKEAFPKKQSTTNSKWVENKTYKEKTPDKKATEKKKEIPSKKEVEKK